MNDRIGWILVGVLSGLASPTVARACTAPPPEIQISPRLGIDAPQNATVQVRFPALWRQRYLPDKSNQPLGDVLLRRVGRIESIAVQRVDIKQGSHLTVELKPQQLLESGEYEVAAKVGNIELVLGEFTVGRGVDRTAPRWGRDPRAFFPEHMALLLKMDHSLCQLRGIEGDCESDSILAAVDGSGARDDRTPPAALRLAVWLSTGPDAIDYTKAPTEYLFIDSHFPHSGRILDLRRLWDEVPCEQIPPALRTPTSVRLGVRMLDLASNPSPAWETTWIPTVEKQPDPPQSRRRRALAFIPSYPVSTSKKLAPFLPAITRAVTARRWLLAEQECLQAAAATSAMPKPCLKVAQQEEVRVHLPLIPR